MENFLNQKKINVCEHRVKMTPCELLCDIIFTACSYTFILFWLRKTFMHQNASVKFPCPLLVYLYHSCGDLFIFLVRISPFYSYCCAICTSVLFLSKWSHYYYYYLQRKIISWIWTKVSSSACWYAIICTTLTNQLNPSDLFNAAFLH